MQFKIKALYFILVLSFGLCLYAAHAQTTGGQAIAMHFENSTVDIHTGESFSNKLLLTNYTNNDIILVKQSNDSLASVALPDTIRLAGKTSRTFFTRYFAQPSLLRSLGNQISVRYKLLPLATILAAGFTMHSNIEQVVSLQTTAPTVYLDGQSNTAAVTLRCLNTGYTGLGIRIQLKSYPEGIQVHDNGRTVYLEPGQPLDVSFTIRNSLPKNITPDYTLLAEAVNAAGKTLTVMNIRLIVLGSNKRLTQDNTGANNFLQLGYWNSNTGYNYAQLNLKGATGMFTNGLLSYNLNANAYTYGQRGIDLFNTNIEYRNRHMALQAGSITENPDFPVFGNGIKGSAFFNPQSTLSAYYIQNNYYLYSTFDRPVPGGGLWAVSYNYNPSVFNAVNVNFINGTNPVTGMLTSFGNTSIKIPLAKKQTLQIEGGYSREHISNSGNDNMKDGFSAGLHYHNEGDRWKIHTDNYFSSPYYSGFRRGALMLEERIERRLPNNQYIYVRYQKNNSTPEYLNNGAINYTFHTMSAIYEAGIGLFAKRFAFNIRPYYFTQRLTQFFNIVTPVISSGSVRGAIDLSFNTNGNMFILTADAGKTQSDNALLDNRRYNSWWLKFNYSYRFVGFNMQLQQNPYYIIQEPGPWQQNRYRQYSFGPVLYLKAWHGRLDGQAADYLNYYSYSNGWANTAQARANLRIGAAWSATAMVNYNTNEWDPQHYFLQTNIGISKKLSQKNTPGNKKLRLVFFGDENANGKWDNDEKAITGVVANLNNMLAASNRKGKIAYTNLKTGSYKLLVQAATGWSALEPVTILLSRNRFLQVGLVKSAVMAGCVVAEKNVYAQQAATVEGITITAVDEQGNKFTVLTDNNGCFQLTVPANRYTISVETAGHLFSITNQAQRVVIQQQGNPVLTFHLKDQSRKVEVKEF